MISRRDALRSLGGLAAAMLPAGLVTKALAAESSRPPVAVVEAGDPGAPWTTEEWVAVIQEGIDRRGKPATVGIKNGLVHIDLVGGGGGFFSIARDRSEQSTVFWTVPGPISDDAMIVHISAMLASL
jgi:hypothetical protein